VPISSDDLQGCFVCIVCFFLTFSFIFCCQLTILNLFAPEVEFQVDTLTSMSLLRIQKGPTMDELTEYAGGHLNPFTGVDATKNFAILKNTWQASLDKDTFFCEYDALEDKISKIHSGFDNGSDSGFDSCKDTFSADNFNGGDSECESVASGITSVDRVERADIDFFEGIQLLNGV